MAEKPLDEVMSERPNDTGPEDNQAQEQPRDPVTQQFMPKSREQEQPQQPQDEQQQEPQGEAVEQPVAGTVPQQALHASRQKEREATDKATALESEVAALRGQVQAFMRGMQQQQPAQQPEPVPVPDFLENPAGFVQHQARELIDPVQQRINATLMFNARLTAEAVYGKEAIDEAIKTFDGLASSGQIDPRDFRRVMDSPNPFHEAHQWRTKKAALDRYGDDPEAFIKAEVDRRLAERQGGPAQQQPQTQSADQPQLPQSFAQARNSGPRSAPQWNGPRPLSEIMSR